MDSRKANKSLITQLRKSGIACEWADDFGYMLFFDEESSFGNTTLNLLNQVKPVGLINTCHFFPISDDQLTKLLRSCAGVEVLRINNGNSLTMACGPVFENCVNLLNIVLNKTHLTDKFILEAKLPKSLKSLNVNHGQFTDKLIDYISKSFSGVVEIRIASNEISNEGIECFRQLPNLIGLDLSRCSITDDCFGSLGKIQHLRMLLLTQTSVSLDAARSFAAAHPDCVVVVSQNSGVLYLNKDNWNEDKYSNSVSRI